MATRKTPPTDGDDETRELIHAPQGSGAVFDPFDEDDPIARVRAAVSAMSDGEFKTKVYRLVGGEREWLYDTTFSEFEETGMAYIKQAFGGGRFQLYVYGPGGLIGKPTFRIGASANPNPLALAAPAPAPAASSELAAVLSGIVDMQRATLETLQRMAAQPPAPPPDPMAGIRQMTEIITLAKSLQPPPPPAVDPLAMMNQVLATVKSVREVAHEIEPPPESDSPMALAAKGLDLIGALAKNGGLQGANPAAGELPALTPPASLDDSATGDETADEIQTMNPLQIMILRGHLLTLIDLKAKGDPGAAASHLLEKLPEDFVQYLELPNWFEIVSGFVPAAREHQAWLAQVREVALSRLKA